MCLYVSFMCLCEFVCTSLCDVVWLVGVGVFCPPRLCVFGCVAVVVCFVCDALCDGVWFVCW